MSVQVENGYTKIANEILDALCKCHPGFTEGQVLWAVIRKTYGWNKKSDKISISQLVTATKKSRRMVIYAVQNLEAKKMIIVSREFQKTNEISFNKNHSEWIKGETSDQYKKLHLVQEVAPSATNGKNLVQHSVKSLPKVAPTKETLTKETLQKKAELTATFLERFNQIRGTKYKTSITWAENFSYWNKSYSLEEMIRAVKMAQYDPWMNEVISPELLFRTRNKNGSCDYIGKLLNLKVIETEEDILLKTALKGT